MFITCHLIWQIIYFPYAGIIDIAKESLFTYQPGESWATYYDPFFSPIYEPVFSDPILEQEAASICGDNFFCLFDIAATGVMDIGLSTLTGNIEYEDILEQQIPSIISYMWIFLFVWLPLFSTVVCSTPCMNGACVANDTCNCAEGYTGSVCDVQGE